MNETLDVIYKRKSVRAYEDRPIDKETKALLFKAAFSAPTAGNQQLYSIIDVTDQKKKEALSLSCDNQPFIAKAPMVVVFCADCKKWYDAFCEAGAKPRKPDVGDLMLAVDDAVIAAQTMVLAAESLGIGSCYIGDIMENRETQREILNLPPYVFPACMLVLGYPTLQQKERIPPKRVDGKFVVFENGYHEIKSDELREMFNERCGVRGYDDWMQAFCKRKYDSDFSREMSRSVKEYIEKDFSD